MVGWLVGWLVHIGNDASCSCRTHREHYNPFVPWFKLVGCFFSVILTLLWFLHIILYMLFTVRRRHPTLPNQLNALHR